jgi:hypothetical protein
VSPVGTSNDTELDAEKHRCFQYARRDAVSPVCRDVMPSIFTCYMRREAVPADTRGDAGNRDCGDTRGASFGDSFSQLRATATRVGHTCRPRVSPGVPVPHTPPTPSGVPLSPRRRSPRRGPLPAPRLAVVNSAMLARPPRNSLRGPDQKRDRDVSFHGAQDAISDTCTCIKPHVDVQ